MFLELTITDHGANLAPSPRRRVCPLPKWRLKRVRDHIDTHIAEPLTLSRLAGSVGLSPMHFAAQFRVATGLSPHDYLLGRRIERAKSLMMDADIPLAQVALCVGFQGQSHFSTVFKRLTGETPARWKRTHADIAATPVDWRS